MGTIAIATTTPAAAQQSTTETDTIECVIRFRTGMSVVEPDYSGNRERIEQFVSVLNAVETDSSSQIIEIVIEGNASPEGISTNNQKLSRDRASAVRQHLDRIVSINPDKLKIKSNGVNYEKLATMVDTCGQPWAARMSKILRETPLWIFDKSGNITGGKKKQMMDLQGGQAYQWMYAHLFPALRSGETAVTCTIKRRLAGTGTDSTVHLSTSRLRTAQLSDTQLQCVVPGTAPRMKTTSSQPVVTIPRRGYFALKTNMMLDILTVLNVGIEIPIGKRWSGQIEWTFPFWLWERQQYCEQILMWNIEARHWFHRTNGTDISNPLSGWFAGIYGGSAVFDIECNKKGYKSKSSLSAGVTFGYSKQIGTNWRLEFSAGVGYFTAQIQEYQAHYSDNDNKWHLMWQRNRRLTWIGPTKLNITLSWYPQFRHRVKRSGSSQKGGET